jgi:hypothetical protein
MNLPKPPAAYDAADQAQLRRSLEAADARNMKSGTVLDRILMRDTATGAVVTVTIASGVLAIS